MKPQLPHQLLVSLVLGLLAWASHASTPIPIGEVTLAIGRAQVQVGAGGAFQDLPKGGQLHEGDSIRTLDNGHVHIRFVDGARVSVRPGSLFTIEQYRYSEKAPAQSVVRMSLAHGEVRAISGAAAQGAKDRFRLNTPLVAIGVKGTDFVTQAQKELTRVRVNEGAIVMSPFDAHCRAEGLGYCTGQRARELSAATPGMVLEYRHGAADPGLQFMPGKKDSGKTSNPDAARDSSESASKNAKENKLPEDVLSGRASLAWGRWHQTPRPGDALTTSFQQAFAGREVTVGDGYYFLFRDTNTPNLLPGMKGTVDFQLQSSAAQYQTPANEVKAAKVENGNLSLDFAQSRFKTQLQVSAEGLPAQTLSYTGSVDKAKGILRADSSPSGSQLAGALGLDGGQAGYIFKAPIDNGNLRGATLWGR